MLGFWRTVGATCPQCKQHFDEASGFCPFDGTRLVADASATEVDHISFMNDPSHSMALRRLGTSDGEDIYDRLIGTTLDSRYEIERKLGEGGMGVVFLARHSVIEKLVAVKVLKREVARDQSVVKRFVQEAKSASRIGHPNIVDVTDFGTTPDGMTYSVMEFVQGHTLHQLIAQDAPMPPSRVLPIVAQIAKALGAAHDKGIIHRDLKPDNVFVIDRDGRRDFVKIVDFGIAKVLDGPSGDGPRLTRAGAVFGTPEYMAPEQAAGRGDIDHRADIYSLGIILYELLIGRVPHKGDNMMRTLAMQMLDPLVPPRKAAPELEISAELESVVLKALAKKPDERYQSMHELVRGLEGVSGGVPLTQPLNPSARAIAPPTAATLVPPPTETESLASTPPTLPAPEQPEPASPTAPIEDDKSEPAFVRRKRPLSLDMVNSSTTRVPMSPEHHSKWPLVATIAALLAGAVLTVVLLTGRGSDDKSSGTSVAGSAPAFDARTERVDARRPVAVSRADAGPTAPIDASSKPTRKKGRIKKAHNGARKTSPPADAAVPRRSLDIRVLTDPESANLYINNTYSGKGGATLRRREGSVFTVECRLPGYLPGQVEVRFDGKTELYLCKMSRNKRCVEGIKNPFDDCP